jgi:hypothetical protein
MRFAVSTAVKMPAPLDVTALVIDRTAPLALTMPLSPAAAEETALAAASGEMPAAETLEVRQEAAPATDFVEAAPQ